MPLSRLRCHLLVCGLALVECAPDGGEECGWRGGFVEEGGGWVDGVVGGERWVWVSGGVDDRQVGLGDPHVSGEFVAGHVRHDDVGEEYVDRVGGQVGGEVDRLVAAGGGDHLVAVVGQDPFGQGA